MTQPEVISLIRFSTLEQVAEGKAGEDGQRQVNQTSALYHQVKIRREAVVIDVSGRHVLQDPQFRQIFEELKDPTLAGVLVPEQSRLVRPETFDDYAVLAHFQRTKKLIYTPTGRIDLNTSEGRMAAGFGCMMSGEELHIIRGRFARGKATARLQGKHPGGLQMLPRTVRYVKIRKENANGKMVVVDAYWELIREEADRMRRAFQLLFEGDSYELMAEKIGGGWTGSGLHKAMQNPIHIGIRRYDETATGEEYDPKPTLKNPTPKPRRKREKREVIIEVPTRAELEAGAKPIVEPILTLAEWDRAQAIIAERATSWRKSKLKNADRPRFLAHAIGYCVCGQPLYGRYGSRNPDSDAYYCKSCHPKGPGCGMKSIKRIDLDASIEEAVSQLASAKFIIEALTVALQMQQAAPDPNRAAHEKALAALATGRKEMRKALSKGLLSAEDFEADLRALEAECRALEALLPPPVPQVDPVQLADRIHTAFNEFAFLSFADKARLLRSAVKQIIVVSRESDSACSTASKSRLVVSHAGAATQEITSVTIRGGYLGMGANSCARSRASTGISAVPDVSIRFPQPIAINGVYGAAARARMEAQKAATADRQGAIRAGRNARRRAAGKKAVADPEKYTKRLATITAWKRNQRAKLKATDPEKLAQKNAKAAAQLRAWRAKRRSA